ncbi:MAG TPA: aldehyde dehydrogenase family protein, partial [Actinomycetes bacterium]
MRPMFVDGGFYQGAGSDELEVRDPATGEPVDSVPAGTAADVDAAVAAAHAAFPGWWDTPAARRGELLQQATAHVRGHAGELAAQLTREQG